MKDPVMAADAIYERAAIMRWFASGGALSPMTEVHSRRTCNRTTLRQAITENDASKSKSKNRGARGAARRFGAALRQPQTHCVRPLRRRGRGGFDAGSSARLRWC